MINNSCDSRASRVSKEVWDSVRAAYQKGEGSCRELAEKFGLTAFQVSNKCKREKWAVSKSRIEQVFDQTLTKEVTKTVESTVQALAASQRKHIADTLKRASRLRASIDAAIESFPTDPNGRSLIDPEFIEALTRSEQRLDDILRRSLGLPDKNGPANEVNVSVGVGIQQFPPEQLQHLNEARKRWMERMQGGGLNA